eukprot:15458821-Alexandrium_andersonii.AAC.1
MVWCMRSTAPTDWWLPGGAASTVAPGISLAASFRKFCKDVSASPRSTGFSFRSDWMKRRARLTAQGQTPFFNA